MASRTEKVVVACRNASGEPDFFTTEVTVTPYEHRCGVHYDLAEESAAEEDYESPFICYDEQDMTNLRRELDELLTDEDLFRMLEQRGHGKATRLRAAEKLYSDLEQARAALPDAWLAAQCDVPRELIDRINATIDEADGKAPSAA